MKQSEIGLIPDNWDVLPFSRIGKSFLGGGTPSTANLNFWNGNIEWTTSKRLEEGKIYIKDGERKINQIAVDNSSTNIIPKNNLIISTRVTVGKVAINQCDLAISQDLTGILIDKNLYNLEFLAYQLLSERIQLIFVTQKRGATIKGITRDDLKQIKLCIPELWEQRNISSILSLIQSTIQKQEEIIRTTTELKNNIKQKLFTAGIRNESTEQKKIGMFPKSWREIPLIEAVSYIDYGFSAPIPKNPIQHGVKIVSTADINRDGKLLYDKIRRIDAPKKSIERLTLIDGDVLFNWRNSAELIGKTTVFIEQSEPHIFASFILRIRCDEKKTHNYFLSYLLNYFREIEVFIQLSRRAVNQANYNKNEISVLPIPLPSYDEQLEITNALQTLDDKIQHHQRKKEYLTDIFHAMLQKLMTGEIRVHDIDISNEYQINAEPINLAAEI